MNRYDYVNELHDANPEDYPKLYNEGYKLTRLKKGLMQQTRSIRVNLKSFAFNSENRRILNKFPNLKISLSNLTLDNYDWKISKLANEFYNLRFGENTFSVNKLREILIGETDFNNLLIYTGNGISIGYCILYIGNKIMHYSYPFYDLNYKDTNLGMAMMTKAIGFAVDNNFEFVYLGSITQKSDKYKLNFNNIEWFDLEALEWSNDIDKLKSLLN